MSLVLAVTHPLPYLPWLKKRLLEFGLSGFTFISLFEKEFRRAGMHKIDMPAYKLIKKMIDNINKALDDNLINYNLESSYHLMIRQQRVAEELFRREIVMAFAPIRELVEQIAMIAPLP